LPKGKVDVIVFDDRLKGFGLRVRPTGRKWLIQYRDALGADRRFNIGSTHEVTATQARDTAAKLLAGCKLGKYPHIEREERRRRPSGNSTGRTEPSAASPSSIWSGRHASCAARASRRSSTPSPKTGPRSTACRSTRSPGA
jgi:hypothetical protein